MVPPGASGGWPKSVAADIESEQPQELPNPQPAGCQQQRRNKYGLLHQQQPAATWEAMSSNPNTNARFIME